MTVPRGLDRQAIVPGWAKPLVVVAAIGFAAFAIHRYVLGLESHVWLFSLVFPDYGGEQIETLAQWPITELLHRVGGALLLIMGLAQFWPALRRERPALHRWTGRVYVPLALLAAISGIVMALTVPFGGLGETIPSVVFGVALIVVTLLGLARARARQFERHREWMVRSFALCLGPLMIRLVAPIFVYGLGMSERAAIVPSFWAGWMINLAFAETWIQARRRRNSKSST
jgi:uncharacterized membrane protein